MEVLSGKLKVAVVQSSGPFLDRAGCLDRALDWIAQAGREKVKLLAFPEGFIPGHPVWFHFHPVTGRQSLDWSARLFENAVEVDGPEVDAIRAAAKKAGTYVVIGVCEREAGTTGTLFNTQLFIDDGGRLLGKRQKLVPTVGERIVHAPGRGDMLPVFPTPIGRLSGLLCGENANSLAVFALAAQGTQIHVASWPNHFATNEHPMAEAIHFNTLSLSYQASCFVLNACGVITKDLREQLPYSQGDHAFLGNALNGGGSSIVGAGSTIIAGPMPGDEEGLLIADIELGDCVAAKVVHDYSGHYNRADVFTLTVRSPQYQIAERVPEQPPKSKPARRAKAPASPTGDGA
ncbi:MAG TPA: carbon-nitrogen hydrolase family protein [Candidatus Acidoferrales bacterium]|nr:carbon-nitrogen hydrolase family protein [Candidatus Acidoferrales bacterium]